MKIKFIKIENYRLLEDVKIDIANDGTSNNDNYIQKLIIGKNNSGKTSLLTILKQFIDNNKDISFSIYDFHTSKLSELINNIKNNNNKDKLDIALTLTLHISYEDGDDLSKMPPLNLDEERNSFLVEFTYKLKEKINIIELKERYELIKKTIENEKETNHEFIKYIGNNMKSFFEKNIEIFDCEINGNKSHDTPSLKESDFNIKDIIDIEFIEAKRYNKEDKDKRLTELLEKFLKNNKNLIIKDLDDDTILKSLYNLNTVTTKEVTKELENVTNAINNFESNANKIDVMSELKTSDIFKVKTYYGNNEVNLPENYNGLGYLNLYVIIFEIFVKLNNFKVNKKPLNLLFIEEPEAHTHPQMQYSFIKHIKDFISKETQNEVGNVPNLHTIITTHSAHIVSQVDDFNDIVYMQNPKNKSTIAKNLKEIQGLISDKVKDETQAKETFNFLKKYLTINRAELFFADKMILIEGDAERILLPAFMNQIDDKNKEQHGYTPLLAQNISIVSISGAHFQAFEPFIVFFDIKTLIITDIDSTKKNSNDKYEACKVDEGTKTSNFALIHFFNLDDDDEMLNTLKDKEEDSKCQHIADADATLKIAYQTEENNYHARSFEDAFISINYDKLRQKELIRDKKEEKDYYKLAEKLEKKKAVFASKVLYEYYTNEEHGFEIPAYIREGLEWLAK